MVGEKMAKRIRSLEELNKLYTSEIQKKRESTQIEEFPIEKIQLKETQLKENQAEETQRKENQLRESQTEERKRKETQIEEPPIEEIQIEPTVTRRIADAKNKVRDKNKRKAEVEVIKRIVAVSAVAFILLIMLFIVSRRIGEVDGIVPTILSDEERVKWQNMEVQEGKLYIELNSKIEVNDKNANIRLVNPIYSAYTISIQVWEKEDENNLLYESEKLKPGTILETIRLSRALSTDEYKGVVNYIIYDNEGNEKSTYPIDVRLIKQNIGTN